MQVDTITHARWAADAPELIAAVEVNEDACRMRRDTPGGYCVKFEGGLCGIQKKYGADSLSDACYLYPRVTRRLGEYVSMSATLSCPEITRLALFGEINAAASISTAATRLPQEIKEYLPPELTEAQALTVHQAFLVLCEQPQLTAEQMLSRMIGVAYSFSRLSVESWPQAVGFYLQQAEQYPITPHTTLEDPFNMLHAFAGLIVATRTPRAERLERVLQLMQHALGAELNWEQVSITLSADSAARYHQMWTNWTTQYAHAYDTVLKRWLQFQLASTLFPFAGLGGDPAERITILAVRFAMFRLGLMCASRECAPPPEMAVLIAQSQARVLDHLGDSAFLLRAYAEAGWSQESRLCGLLA